MKKSIFVVFLVLLDFLFIPIIAFGLTQSYIINDSTNDCKIFDYSYLESLELDNENPLDSVQDAVKKFSDDFYNPKVATDLTNSQLNRFGYSDFVSFTIDDVSQETATITIAVNGNLDELSESNKSLIICIYNNPTDNSEQMLIVQYAFDGYSFLVDLINDVAYESEFNDKTYEFNTYDVDSEILFTTNSISVLSLASISDDSESDIIVDLIPNPINVMLYLMILLIFIIAIIGIIIYMKYK